MDTQEEMSYESGEGAACSDKAMCIHANPTVVENLTNFSHMYKGNTGAVMGERQAERRKKHLFKVKQRRVQSLDEKRGIHEIYDLKTENEATPMDVSEKKHGKKSIYANKLMLSEYFLEVPEDLESNWIFKFCPIGIRNLVVANNRKTISYNKQGHIQSEFVSMLPGGGPNRSAAFTILDCIYNQAAEVYYVLDLIAWNSYSLRDCSTEFRFFFLKSKIEENPEVKTASRHNKYAFCDIISYPAQRHYLEGVFSNSVQQSDAPLDGVLFYHSDVDYRECITPLVGWLKPFMISEVLGIHVHEDYMKDKPNDYLNIHDYISNYKERIKKKYPKRLIDNNTESVGTRKFSNYNKGK